MAFGNYYNSTLPAYTQPYYQPQPMMNAQPINEPTFQQPTQPRPNQTVPNTIQNAPIQTSVLWVSNEAEARDSFVLANNTVLIIQKDMSKLYIKSADNIGRVTLDSFDIKKVTQNADNVPKNEPQQAETIDLSNFITRDEVAKMIPKNEDYVTRSELDEILSAKNKKQTKTNKED